MHWHLAQYRMDLNKQQKSFRETKPPIVTLDFGSIGFENIGFENIGFGSTKIVQAGLVRTALSVNC